jgi:hypothetical protein
LQRIRQVLAALEREELPTMGSRPFLAGKFMFGVQRWQRSQRDEVMVDPIAMITVVGDDD